MSFVYPKLPCIELLISLHNDRNLFADGFVTVRPIAMKVRWDKENVSSLKFRKFHLNPPNFNRKLTMLFKLDFKKWCLPHLEPRCKSQYILHRKWTLVCFLCNHQKSYKLDQGIMLIFVSQIEGHYFWRRVHVVRMIWTHWSLISIYNQEETTPSFNPLGCNIWSGWCQTLN